MMLAALLLAGSAVGGGRSALAQEDPVTLYEGYIDALNSGDIDAVMAFFADGATVESGPCMPCDTPDGIRAFFDMLIADDVQLTITSTEVDGSTVTAMLEGTLGSTVAAGVDRALFTDIVEFNSDGLIASFVNFPDAEDEQTATWIEYILSQMPPPADDLPETGSAPLTAAGTSSLILAAWFALVGGLVALSAGFAVRRRRG